MYILVWTGTTIMPKPGQQSLNVPKGTFTKS